MKKIIYCLFVAVLLCSCDSKIATNLEGYWQSSSEVVKFERFGELGGMNDDGYPWYVKFSQLHWRNKVYDMKWDNNKLTLKNPDGVKADDDFKVFYKITEAQATRGNKFADDIVKAASDAYTYMGVNGNTLRNQLGYSSREFNLVSDNTYSVYFDEIDCGDNIFHNSQTFKVDRRSTKVQVFVQSFIFKNGTSPQRVAIMIKDRLQKKFNISMESGKLAMDIGSDQFEQPAYYYMDFGGANSYAIIYDENCLDFVVGFNAPAMASFLNMAWGD